MNMGPSQQATQRTSHYILCMYVPLLGSTTDPAEVTRTRAHLVGKRKVLIEKKRKERNRMKEKIPLVKVETSKGPIKRPTLHPPTSMYQIIAIHMYTYFVRFFLYIARASMAYPV
ncbi:hypothetical protein K504DRAFT_27773 [Pleomassaria siparia CBS 279.74]|uniref:Uncharacterized protein n=1 Tax=Pleomassaria siparia CBS 279.74 TaxID=1314801 RepID=A0A6G1KRK1_9PLEO|nr:hypothetical protein K504DRAFT_27773 [Pleomassaria siparia CBS 279.74]